MPLTPEELMKRLSAPFQFADVDWRVQHAVAEKNAGWAVAYLTSRAIQQRLDETVGADNWCNRFLPWHGAASQLCGISIYFSDRGEWIEKFDGAENTEFEAIKGGLSDSMKRCAVQWGIGRYLYGMNMQWVSVEKRGKSWYILDSEQPKLQRAYETFISGLNTPCTEGAPPVQKAPQSPAQGTANQAAKPDLSTQVYMVVNCTVEPAVNGADAGNMRVTLQNSKGERQEAFLQGVDPNLIQGARIDGLKMKNQDSQGYKFYIITNYHILPPQQAAA